VSNNPSNEAELRIGSVQADVKVGGAPFAGAEHGSVATTGVVVIGRNEGDRLKCCLESLREIRDRTVYVDSGSSDDSVAMSRSAGALVLDLAMTTPFTAARARNAGFDKLVSAHPGLVYVFFVDGDCEVMPAWVETAVEFLNEHPDIAAVWGQRRERYPEKTVYNMLSDLEYREYPFGNTKSCGGDAVMRVAAFHQVRGFRPDLICGEEPELCIRLRQRGWRIWRLREDMTLHDIALDRFSQWWNRSVRTGYGFAQGVDLHGAPPEKHWVSQSRRAWLWGLGIPAAILLLSAVFTWWSLLLFAVYPFQVARMALRGKYSRRQNWWRAAFLVLGKFPEMLGQLRFLRDRYLRVQSRLIEYK
jgi:GT2 family glycosyltransferase